jgi:hypothetical protein
MQEPPAPPAPPTPPEVRTRVMMFGTNGHVGLDRDGDGQITREEFASPMNDAFARMDADGDGRLSGEEVSAHPGPGHPDVMILRGGEPGVQRFELRRSDGPSTPEEMREIVIRRPADETGPQVVHFESRGDGRMDADGDGKVSEGEFTARLQETFARLDVDGSGFLEDGERGGSGEVRIITRRIERSDDAPGTAPGL